MNGCGDVREWQEVLEDEFWELSVVQPNELVVVGGDAGNVLREIPPKISGRAGRKCGGGHVRDPVILPTLVRRLSGSLSLH